MSPCFESPFCRLIVSLGAIVLLCAGEEAIGYEFSTHAAITREGFYEWLADPANADVLDRLGVVAKKDALGSVYIDMAAGSVERLASPETPPDFAERIMSGANFGLANAPAFESIGGWLMLGAIREDDVPFDPGSLHNTPQDEPGGPFIRVQNHFFDPFFDRPFSVLLTEQGSRAPDWAVAGLDQQGQHQNHFAVIDARDAMWKALTLKLFATQLLVDLPFNPTSSIPTREALRTAYWATTFRALGDTAHLLQDMAQPQHTRNDSHAGLLCVAGHCALGPPSYFENYVEARSTGAGSFRLRERFYATIDIHDIDEQVAVNPLAFGGYPLIRFANFRDFFSTGTGGDSYTGKGLANYSNQGFFTAGTNILNTNGYLRPSSDPNAFQKLVIPEGSVVDALGQTVSKGALTLLVGAVADAAHPELTDGAAVKLTSLGAFDQFLHASTGQYSLNHYNYDDQARLLIPRAVGYTAGLIDFFFRGKMEISLPDEGVYSIVDHAKFAPPAAPTNGALDFRGFKTVRLHLKNITDDVTPPQGGAVQQAMSGGTLVAVLKFRRNLCYVDSLDNEITDASQADACRNAIEEIVVSDPLTNQSVPFGDATLPAGPELTFTFQQELPINAWDVVLQVVYRGALGSEADAVAVATKDISEPTFAATFNDTDFVAIGSACYQADTIPGNNTLWNQLISTCMDTQALPRKVSGLCAKVPLNLRYTFGNATKPVVVATEQGPSGDGRLPSRRFSRIAVLGEAGTPLSYVLDFNNPPLYIPGGDTEPESLLTYRVQKEAQIASVYSSHRGIKYWEAAIVVVDGTTASVAGGCPEPNQDLLHDTERYPIPVTITGWD
jgi:hypothetical protein